MSGFSFFLTGITVLSLPGPNSHQRCASHWRWTQGSYHLIGRAAGCCARSPFLAAFAGDSWQELDCSFRIVGVHSSELPQEEPLSARSVQQHIALLASQCPVGVEEVKIMLPLTLNQATHLFFSFYQVSIKKKPGQSLPHSVCIQLSPHLVCSRCAGKKELIGYSVLPLFPKNRLATDDVYSLPIASKLPKNYIIPFMEGKKTDQVQFCHDGARDFRVRLKLVSSIFNQVRTASDLRPRWLVY
jgi:hypothetical protein